MAAYDDWWSSPEDVPNWYNFVPRPAMPGFLRLAAAGRPQDGATPFGALPPQDQLLRASSGQVPFFSPGAENWGQQRDPSIFAAPRPAPAGDVVLPAGEPPSFADSTPRFGEGAAPPPEDESTLRQATAALAPWATGNARMGGASSVEGVGSDLSNRFLQMAQAMPEHLRGRLAIISGYRDRDRQMEVNPDAPNSRHGAGTGPPGTGAALDLVKDPEVLAWIRANPQYGVGFPLYPKDPREINHLEAISPGGGRLPIGSTGTGSTQAPQGPQRMAGIGDIFNALSGGVTPGLLDQAGYMDPTEYDRAKRSQSMMGLWAGLLQGGGPSLEPRNFGSALGAGLLGQQKFGTEFDEAAQHRATAQSKLAEIEFKKKGYEVTQQWMNQGRPGVVTPADAAAGSGGSGTTPPAAASGGGGADPRGMEPYIRAEAARLNIDPDIAVRVAQSEGLGTFSGDGGKSGGAFQLYTGGGVGNLFQRDTGLDPLDPKNEQATITYALQHAAKNGWGDWNGAKKLGITGFTGIGERGGTPAATTALSAVPDFAGMFASNQGASYAPAAPGTGGPEQTQVGNRVLPPDPRTPAPAPSVMGGGLGGGLRYEPGGYGWKPPVPVQGNDRPINVEPLSGEAVPAGPPAGPTFGSGVLRGPPAGAPPVPSVMAAPPVPPPPAAGGPPGAASVGMPSPPGAAGAAPVPGAMTVTLPAPPVGPPTMPQAQPLPAAPEQPGVPARPVIPRAAGGAPPAVSPEVAQRARQAQGVVLGLTMMGVHVPDFLQKEAGIEIAGRTAAAEAEARQPIELQNKSFEASLTAAQKRWDALTDQQKETLAFQRGLTKDQMNAMYTNIHEQYKSILSLTTAGPIAQAQAEGQEPSLRRGETHKTDEAIRKEQETPREVKILGPDGKSYTRWVSPKQLDAERDAAAGIAPGAAASPGAAGAAPVPGVLSGESPRLEEVQKGLGRSQIKTVDEIQEAGKAATRSRPDTEFLLRGGALDWQGPLAPGKQAFNRLTQSVLGWNSDHVASYEQAQYLMGQRVRAALRASDPNPTERQQVALNASFPTPETSEKGYKAELKYMQGIEDWQVYRQRALDNHMRSNRNDPQGFDDSISAIPFVFLRMSEPDKDAYMARLAKADPAAARRLISQAEMIANRNWHQ